MRNVEQEARLGNGRRGLHENGGADFRHGKQRAQLGEIEIAEDWRQLRDGLQPAVIAPRESPDVMVRIDSLAHTPRSPGTGARGSISLRSRSTFQNSTGI